MTIYSSMPLECDEGLYLERSLEDCNRAQTDLLIQSLVKKVEMLEKRVLEPKANDCCFYDLTTLAKKIVPSTVKITADYNWNTLYTESFMDLPVSGHGSGCVISDDGYILTNFHVVDGASEIQVYNNYTQKFYDAKIFQVDPDLDLALIKIEEENLPFFEMGNANLIKPGDFVALFGNPLGFKNLLTLGVVGNVAQGLFEAYEYGWEKGDVGRFADYIISDTVCNPGNSGGPLVNMQGQLVAIASRAADGLGISITSNTALQFLDSIQEDGRLFRNIFSAKLVELSSQDCAYFNFPKEMVSGVVVADLKTKGWLEGYGLQRGDIIVSYNENPCKSLDQFQYDLVRNMELGEVVQFEILRNHDLITLTIPLQTEDVYRMFLVDALGVKVRDLPGEVLLDSKFEVADLGVEICEVEAMSKAYLAGLSPGDVIVGVLTPDFQEVSLRSVDDLLDQLMLLQDKKQIYFQVSTPYCSKKLVVPIEF